jgi:hypothetical protein
MSKLALGLGLRVILWYQIPQMANTKRRTGHF